jgi:hypothetical protein
VTAFHQQNFKQRFGTMGDTAEGVFDLVHPKHHKLGLNRPPFFMGGMALALRYTPDRMLRDRVVECMGIGRDRKLKLKTEKVEALQQWELMPDVVVWLFVFDQHKGTYYEAPLADWGRQIRAHGIARTFENDGKAYDELHADWFPSEPQPIPPIELPEELAA